MRIDCTETKKTDWHEDKQLDRKTKKSLKKPTLSVINAGPPKCGGRHPKGLIVASLYIR